jgi:deoxyribonuclease V
MISELLDDRYSKEKARKLQLKYLSKVQNAILLKLKLQDLTKIKLIAGVDISYFSKKNQEFGIACSVLWDLRANKVIEKQFAQGKIDFPYIAGYLGFRECKLLAKVIGKLKNTFDVVMCDGHGKIHPRRFGEAVQLGIALDIPTIGVAKSPYIGHSDWKKLERKKGNKTPVLKKNLKQEKKSRQELLGYAICLRDGSKPVFISEGYKIDIHLALEIALNASKKHHRLPEPLFLADHLSQRKIRD